MSATPGRMIKGILALQLAVGLVLVGGDLLAGFQGFGGRTTAPSLDAPTRPGDQTRRYSPNDVPRGPGTPFPDTGDMPSRLSLTRAETGERAVLRLTGTIAPGDAERLSEYLAARAQSGPQTVLLNSPGGSVRDALALGRQIRRLGLETEIGAGDMCFSACPYLLMGGEIRRVDPDGAVGVHQHYFGENRMLPTFLAVEDIQRGQGEVMAYLVEMGIDPRLMQPALTTPPDEIYILTPDELRDYAVTPAPEDTA